MTLRYSAERAISPVDGGICHVVVDADFGFQLAACAYWRSSAMRDGDRIPRVCTRDG